MAHIKVWLVVCMTIALSGLAWFLPTQEAQRVEQLKQQLVPLQKSRDLHQRMYRHQQKLLKQTQKLARHSGLKTVLTPLAQRGLSRWNWRERQAYRATTQQLKAQGALFKSLLSFPSTYLFSNTRRLLVKSGKTIKKVKPDAHPLTRLPMVESALQGKPQIGLWSLNNKPHLIASAPVYVTEKKSDQSDDSDSDSADAKDTPPKLVGVILIKQKLSQKLFANLGFLSNDQKTPLIVLFNHKHPFLYRVPNSRKVLVKRSIQRTSAPPPGAQDKPLPKIQISPLLQSLQRWTARHFTQFTNEARQGAYRTSKPVYLQGQPYHYVVGRLPAPVSDGQVGYVMLHPITLNQQPFYQSPFFLIGSLCAFFALFLGIWFSFSWARQRSGLKKLFTEFSMEPESLKSVQQIPGSFTFLFQHMRLIAQKLKQKGTTTLKAGVMESLEIHGASFNRPTSHSMEMIRALTEDGSMVLPQRPQGMTYIQKPEKEELEASLEPAHRGFVLQAGNNSSLPSFIDAEEAEGIVPSSAPQAPFSFDAHEKQSDTPVPASFQFPDPSSLLMEPSLVATAEPLSARGAPSTPPMMPPMNNSPRPSEGNALLNMLQNSPAQPAGPVAASSLPMVLHEPAPIPEPLSPPQPAMTEPVDPEQSKNLSSELDDVFSMIAGSTPVPSIDDPPAHPQSNDDPMSEPLMRRVFDEYLNVRRSCGEPTHNIPWESFVDLLHKQRTTILQQYSCKDVQFYVQEKNGRASLKATPVN